MRKMAGRLKNVIARWFEGTSDKKIVDAINIENTQSMYRFSVIVAVIETISMIMYGIANMGNPNLVMKLMHVAICVVVCLIVAAMSHKARTEYRRSGTVSNLRSTIMVNVFYIVLSVWGAYGDIEHYAAGEQMLTFYIVQFCFLCLIVMTPKIGIILISISFAFLYAGMHFVDGAVKMEPPNYFIFWIIAICGNAIQYTLLRDAEENKIELTELNGFLQKEAAVDDLTGLSNRYALTRDQESFIGKSVYVTMADIDYFKRYNDTYGHLIGDKVLELVAACIKESFGDGYAYRFGGDEFLFVLTGCSHREYEDRIAKWKESVKMITIPDVSTIITCSSGCGYGVPRNKDDFQKIIKEADDRLYDVKKART